MAKLTLMDSLHTLKQIGFHIGMYGKAREISDSMDKHVEVNKDDCSLAMYLYVHPETSIVVKYASSLILDYYIPEWRSIVEPEMLGHILERDSKEVRQWKARVLERDEHKCNKCGSVEKLDVHHLIPWSEAPDLRINLDNGLTLCILCHSKEHEDISQFILSRLN